MVFKSKIKWVALLVLILSMASLALHLFLAKSSTASLVQYSTMAALSHDFASLIGTQNIRITRLWGVVKPLDSLQPHPVPRSNYPADEINKRKGRSFYEKMSVKCRLKEIYRQPDAPTEHNNGFIYAKIYGGLPKIKSTICDLVTISRLLNATLVLPEIQESIHSKGISNKFKSFSYLFNEEQFIASLTNDVIIVRSLPENLKVARKLKEFPTFQPKRLAAPKFYIEEVLPVLQKAKVIGLIISEGGCLQSILPPIMSEYQRLRCRVGFHALQFRSEIQALGRQMVERLRAWGHPFLAYHPGLQRDTLAYHGCAELFQDVHTELIQYRRAQMIKSKLIDENLSVDSHVLKRNGSCPLMPEEVGVLLRAMGYPPKTIIYLSGSEIFGGQRVLIPLRAMFANLVDQTSLCSKQELSDLVGPETPLPPDSFQFPPAKSEQQLAEEWKKAGPRPRPLPPPPGRPIYRHEKEGWYGWVTQSDTEPAPSPMNLRMKAHRLLWDALDYIVSVEADAFFPGFNNDGSGRPDFSSLVMGQRLYERASFRTYRPDRKVLVELLNITSDNMYHLQRNWTLMVQEHLNKTLGEEGLLRQSLLSKPTSFLSHPLPECSCRISSAKIPDPVKDNDGRFLYGGEDECPTWMQNSHQQQVVPMESGEAEMDKSEENDISEYKPRQVEQVSNDSGGRVSESPPSDQDEATDPND